MEKGSDKIFAEFLSVKRRMKKFRWNTVIFRLSKDDLIQSPTDTVVTMEQVKQIKIETHPHEDLTTHLRFDQETCVNSSEVKVDYSINVVVTKARHTPIFFSVVSMFTSDRKVTIQEERIDPDDVATSPLHEQTEGKSELFSWITPSDYFAQELLPSEVVCVNDVIIEDVTMKNTCDIVQIASSDQRADSDKLSSDQDIYRPHSSSIIDSIEIEKDINEVEGKDYQRQETCSTEDSNVTIEVEEDSLESPEEIITDTQSSKKWADVTAPQDSRIDHDNSGKDEGESLQETKSSPTLSEEEIESEPSRSCRGDQLVEN